MLPKAAILRFIAEAKDILKTQYPDGAAGDDFTGVATGRHFTRLQQLIFEATAAGAEASVVMAPARDGQRKLPLPVLTGCPDDMRVMQEEIFGPVLPLVAAESLDAEIAYVNDRPHPLALYLFSNSGAQQQHMLQSTLADGVSVNETLMHIAQDGRPFGCVGPSGMGLYHGKFGFDTMSKLKPVFRQSRINALGLFSPPYGVLFLAGGLGSCCGHLVRSCKHSSNLTPWIRLLRERGAPYQNPDARFPLIRFFE